MAKRPFFVLPNGECVPLEGDWHVACLRGNWYLLGHHSVVACDSERAARRKLEDLSARTEADLLASEAIEGLERISESRESDWLG